MEQDWVVLRLPPDLLQSLRTLAREARVTPGQFLRNHVAEKAGAARAAGTTGAARAVDPVPRPAGAGVAMLRELVEDILGSEDSWHGLQLALMDQGFALRVEGFGLKLHAWPSDEPICKSAELGFSYAALLRRLGPGEPPAPDARRVAAERPRLDVAS